MEYKTSGITSGPVPVFRSEWLNAIQKKRYSLTIPHKLYAFRYKKKKVAKTSFSTSSALVSTLGVLTSNVV